MLVISKIDENILRYLDECIFEYRGKGFSFQIGYREKEQCVSGPILGRGTSWRNTNKETLSTLKRILPKEVSTSQESGNAIINTRVDKGKIIETRGKIFNCIVPDYYSYARFEALFSYGDTFCDYLMNNRSDLVLRLLRSIISEKMFSVDKAGFLTYVPYDSDSYIFFSNYNMEALNSISECYGLAMALVKTLDKHKSEFAGYSFKAMRYHAASGIYSEGISLTFDYQETNSGPKLERW